MASYGENIRLRREELGMSQVQLAELIGESKQTVWKYESGTVTNIPLPKVELIAKALHCSTAYITGWEDKQKEPATHGDRQEENEENLLDIELLHRLMKLSPEELDKVDAFVQGLLASR